MWIRIIMTIVFFNISLFGCCETLDSHYNSLNDARKDGAIKKGWIPPILPESSYDIYERHNIDNNMVWVRFRFDANDLNNLLEKLQKLNNAEIDFIKFISPNSAKWWPRKINKDLLKKYSNVHIYKYNRMIAYSNKIKKAVPSYIIIDNNSNTAYYWQHTS